MSLFQSTKNFSPEKMLIKQSIDLLVPYKVSTGLISVGGSKNLIPGNDATYIIPNDLKEISACFSPGVGNRKQFEDDLLKRFGISSFLCDYSSEERLLSTPLIEGKQFFIKRWLSANSDGNNITLEDWINQSNQLEGDLILQMDIEGSEWEVLETLRMEVLQRFRIIAMELHGLREIFSSPEQLKNKFFPSLANLSQEFVCVYVRPNNMCGPPIRVQGYEIPDTIEITFYRRDRCRSPLRRKNAATILCLSDHRRPPQFLGYPWQLNKLAPSFFMSYVKLNYQYYVYQNEPWKKMKRRITHITITFKAFKAFFFRQINEIKTGGKVALKRKTWVFINDVKNFFHILLFVPFVLLIRLLAPLIIIRFGTLISDRIGHFCANTELYCLEKKNLNSTKRYRDFFILRYPISNKQLLKMWRRKLNFHDFFRGVERVNRIIPGGDDHKIRLPSDRDTKNLFYGTKPQLYFSPKEFERGKEFLKSIEVKDEKFVCFHTRDTRYIKTLTRIQCRNNPEKLKSNKHDYRNSDIKNCLPAMEQLGYIGYHCFRMGALVNTELKTENPRIIDYGNNGMRSDFLDIFLSANCRFFVSDPCGLDAVATIFRVPLLSVNMIPIEHTQTYLGNHIFIPKKLWVIGEHRFLNFSKMYKSGAGRFLHTEEYKELGLEVIDNTSEEIKHAVLEMEARLGGSWVEDKEDEKLQGQFWETFPKSELHGKFRARIGSQFLRENRELL